MRKRQIKGDRGNLQEILGLKKISCGEKFAISDMENMISALEGKNTDMRYSPFPDMSCTYDFPHPTYSGYHSQLHPPITLSYHNPTFIAEHKVVSSLSHSRCHDHVLTHSMTYTEASIHRVQHSISTVYIQYSIHPVQHTPSTLFTEYSIHPIQHMPSTVFTKECL